MSELDAGRRALLVGRVGAVGQCLITTTDLGHVPGADGPETTRLAVADGEVRLDGSAVLSG
jgi:DNA replication and repair protein RecF